MRSRTLPPWAVCLIGLTSLTSACGTGATAGSASSGEEVCAFDGAGGTFQMRSGSSHADIWQDLTLDLASGRLTGRVSRLDEGQARVDDIDETIAPAALSSLQQRLRVTCGELASAEAPPDDMGGGSSALVIESPSHGSFEIIGTGVNSSAAEGTHVLEVSREAFLQLSSGFPRPGTAP